MTYNTFTAAYLEAALWSSTDDNGDPLDYKYSFSDIAAETLERMLADCKAFQAAHWDDIACDLSRAGHDFWLTRERHGAGFWDGDWPEPAATRLTDASHAFGEFSLYIGDDGKVYA